MRKARRQAGSKNDKVQSEISGVCANQHRFHQDVTGFFGRKIRESGDNMEWDECWVNPLLIQFSQKEIHLLFGVWHWLVLGFIFPSECLSSRGDCGRATLRCESLNMTVLWMMSQEL